MLALTLAACESSASKPSAASSGSASGASASASPSTVDLSTLSKVSLTVGLATPSAQNGDLFWAIGTGIFDKLGLSLKADSSAGGNTASELASGQLVVGNSGVPQSFAPIASGRKLQLIFADTSGDGAAAITVKASSPYKAIMDLSGKTVGTIGVNGASYGAAAAYSQYIVAQGGKALKLVVGANAAADQASLVAGSIDAIVSSPSFPAGIASGQLRQMLATNDPQAIMITGGRETASAYLGLADGLTSNADAITRFIAGMRVARMEVENQTSADVATQFQKSAPFAPSVLTAAAMSSQIDQVRGFWAQDDLQITEDQWKLSLDAFSKWGLTVNNAAFDETSPMWSYANVVNMSYWNAATPLVNSYVKQYGNK